MQNSVKPFNDKKINKVTILRQQSSGTSLNDRLVYLWFYLSRSCKYKQYMSIALIWKSAQFG